MNNYSYVRLALATPTIRVADINYNKNKILELARQAYLKKASIVAFPELSLSSSTAFDLLYQSEVHDQIRLAINELVYFTSSHDIIMIFGSPIEIESNIYNVALVAASGKILGLVPKTHNNYNYENKYFSNTSKTIDFISYNNQFVPIGQSVIFDCGGNFKFTVEIGSDLLSPISPASLACLNGANLVVNISSIPAYAGSDDTMAKAGLDFSKRALAAYAYTASGYGESTTDRVYSGQAYFANLGQLLDCNKSFSMDDSLLTTDLDLEKISNLRKKSLIFKSTKQFITSLSNFKSLTIDIDHRPVTLNSLPKLSPHPFLPENIRSTYIEDIVNIQAFALIKRLKHINLKKVVIGVSGGLDSTLALLIIRRAFNIMDYSPKNIIAINMPGLGTSDKTYNNSKLLCQLLDLDYREISIVAAVKQHFVDIGHGGQPDVTYENAQARERTQILMDIAGKENAIVIGTGDLSELALGFATYNGDHMSMYSLNSNIAKTMIGPILKYLSRDDERKIQDIIDDIISTPISPELLPTNKDNAISQKTEDIIGPYELHDFFIYNLLTYNFSPKKIFALALSTFEYKYSKETILKWLKIFYKRFITNQFKRNCLPDGPSVFEIGFSPRDAFKMASDVSYQLWIDELEGLNIN